MLNSPIETAQTIGDKVIERTPYFAAATTFFSGLTATEIGIYGSLAVALLTMIVNFYYQRRRDQFRERQTQIMEQALLHNRRTDIANALTIANTFTKTDEADE